MGKHRILVGTIIVILILMAASFLTSKAYKAPTPSPVLSPAPKAAILTSQKWTWVNTKMNDGSVTKPSAPGKFTLTFGEDGSLIATTDCNNGRGTYQTGADNALTIGPMATTLMACDGSVEPQFYQQLNNVGSYKISNGQLWLMIKFDSGTMIFN